MLTGVFSGARFRSSGFQIAHFRFEIPARGAGAAARFEHHGAPVGLELVGARFEIRAGHAGAFARDRVLEGAGIVAFERPGLADVDVHHADAAARRAGDAHQRIVDALAIGGELDAAEAVGKARDANEIAGREAIEQRLRGAQDGAVRADAQAAFINDEQQEAARRLALIRGVGRFTRSRGGGIGRHR